MAQNTAALTRETLRSNGQNVGTRGRVSQAQVAQAAALAPKSFREHAKALGIEGVTGKGNSPLSAKALSALVAGVHI